MHILSAEANISVNDRCEAFAIGILFSLLERLPEVVQRIPASCKFSLAQCVCLCSVNIMTHSVVFTHPLSYCGQMKSITIFSH